MSLFTPTTGTLGGSLIGLSAALLLLVNGDILGCSGIVSSIFLKKKETLGSSKGKWKVIFTTAFLISSRVLAQWLESKESLVSEQKLIAGSRTLPIVSTLGYCVSGFFVGFGTRLSNGCTSGHGICGLARLSKRSLVAVATFMSTGMLSATMCSPSCNFAKFMTTSPEDIEKFYPNENSKYYSALLIAVFSGMVLPLLGYKTKSAKDKSDSSTNNDEKKGLVAAFSAFIFAAGLSVSGMTKQYKIFGFLDLKGLKSGTWDGTLMCVMGGGLFISAFAYHFVKGHNIFKNDKALSCPLGQNEADGGKFNVPSSTKIDKQLIIGSAFFGIGWGMGGLCPGPALYLLANGYPQVFFYWWPSNIAGAYLGEKAKSVL